MKQGENSIAKFSASSLADWERAATEELQGANPWTKLTNVLHGIPVKPYYMQDHAVESSFRLSPSKDSYLGPRRWYNCPRVIVIDAAKANRQALEHLQLGADGIFFELDKPVDIDVLLESINWPSCSLNFLARNHAAVIAQRLADFLKGTMKPTNGAFFGSGPPEQSNPHFRFVGHTIPAPIPSRFGSRPALRPIQLACPR